MTITFDSITLTNPEPFDKDWGVQANEEKLYSGKTAIQTTTETRLAVAFKCETETYTDISNLRAKIGLKKTLTIDGTDYTNTVIKSFNEKEWTPGKYTYEISFIQQTA